MKATIEQTTIINAVKTGKNIAVQALAGTGKSTTLRMIAKENPTKNFLALCFNSANAEESNNHPNKPDNIIYSTVHSLAYQATMKHPSYKAKLNSFLDYKDLNEPLIKSIIGNFPELGDKQKLEALFKVKRAMLDVVTYYCRTDKTSIISYANSLLTSWFTVSDTEYYRKLELPSYTIEKLAEYCKEYWLALINPNDKAKITHDVYLKLFELQNTRITSVYDKVNKCNFSVDCIMLDEYQDSNPVTLSIFNNQTHLQRILVGDSNQQLYSWRGATGAIDNLQEYTLLPLVTSFRFNQRIADIANEVLSLNTDLRLIGAGTKKKIASRAHLCKTNSAVLTNSIAYIESGLKVYTNIDLNDLFSKLWHLQACYFNEKPKYPNKELSNITDKESLFEAMRYNDQLALINKLGEYLNKKYGNLTNAKKEITGKILTKQEGSDITISTIHRSKGMEWSEVTIDDDLIPDSESSPRDVQDWLSNFDNRCLLYVAITRAEVTINLPYYIAEYLDI